MKKKLIQDKTFNTYCEFVWDCSEEEFLNYINKRNGTNYELSGVKGKCVYHEDEKFLRYHIWINHKKNYETLAHEILHLIRFWLQNYYKIDLNEETEEVYALLHSFYFKECFKLIN